MRIRSINLRFLILWLGLLLLPKGPFTTLCSADVKESFNTHRYDDAISELEQLLKGKNPSDYPDLLFDLGKAYHKKGLIYTSFYEIGREVERDYYEFLEKFKIESCLPFYLGVCHFEMVQYRKAMEEFNALKRVKNLSKTYQLLSSVWIEASRFQLGQEVAIINLEEIKRKNPHNPTVVSEVAYFLSYLQNKDKEALQFVQGIKPPADSFQGRFYRNLAYIYMKNDMPEKAKEAYQLIKPEKEEFVAEINPELKIYFYDITAIKILALLNYYLSDRAFSEMVKEKMAPELWQQVLYFRGLDAFYLSDYQKTVELLKQCEHPVAGVWLGSAYYKLGQETEAMAAWGEVEKSENEWALRELGRQYSALSTEGGKVDPAKGVKLCEQALELNKKGRKPETRYFRYLGWAYLQSGDPNKAMEVLEEGYEHSRTNDLNYYEPELLNERAFCFYKKSESKWNEAIEIYFVLQQRYPAVRQIHYALQGLAVGLREKGDTRY